MKKDGSEKEILVDTYQNIRSSIVAIVARLSSKSDFPDIIGTGFIIDPSGLIVTCDHVMDLVKRLPRRKDAPPEEWPIHVILFHLTPEGMATFYLQVVGIAKPKAWKRGFDYAPNLPDIGLIKVNTINLPSLELFLDMEKLSEGKKVAVAGFPMGTDTLRAPGWIQQFTPTLQEGVISAVMPFPCPNPHAFLLDIMTEGGSSGSPVFDPYSGKVIGMIDTGLISTHKVGGKKGDDGILIYKTPTSLTTAISSKVLNLFINTFKKSDAFKKIDFKQKDLRKIIKSAQGKMKEGKVINPLQPIDAEEIIIPQAKKSRSKNQK